MRKKLRTLKNKRACVVGTVQKIHTNDSGQPCVCIVNVRLKDTDKILTDHVWIEGNWIRSENLKVGDKIQFYGLIHEYRKSNRFSRKAVWDYGFSQIRNVKKIKDAPIGNRGPHHRRQNAI